MTHRRRQSTGFTLIEIILALLVISVGIVSVIGVLSSSVDTSAKSQQDLTAVTFADMVLNYCRAEGFDALPADTGLSLINMDGETETLTYDSIELYSGILPAAEGAEQEYTLSYRLSVTEETDVKSIHLEVWPGINSDEAEPVRFYTEIYNWNQSL